MIGTTRARLPFVPLSMTPPGAGVVWRRTFQVQAWRLMSARRTSGVSPMRAAVQAVNATMSAHPAKRPCERSEQGECIRAILENQFEIDRSAI
jgi:hypothetical protein